jgi:hypothetical protein
VSHVCTVCDFTFLDLAVLFIEVFPTLQHNIAISLSRVNYGGGGHVLVYRIFHEF